MSQHAESPILDFKPTLDRANDPVFCLAPDGTLLYANRRCAQEFGIGGQDIVGRSVFESLPDSVHPAIRQALRDAAQGRDGRIEGLRIDRIEGGSRVYSVGYSAIDTLDGAVRGLLAIGRDVTETHKTEQALREAEVALGTMLASTLDPIVTIDVHGVIRQVSDSIERVTGWTPRELLGGNVNILMPEPHHSEHDAYLAEYRRTGRTKILGMTREFEAVRKDGSVFPCDLSVSRADLPPPAGPLFTGILRDISQRKRRGEELQRLNDSLEEKNKQLEAFVFNAEKLSSLGKLAASVAHEIRNPLTALKIRLFSIRRALRHDAKLTEKCRLIGDEFDRLERVVGNFLDFSRPPELKLKRLEVAGLIDKTLELIGYRFRMSAIEFERVDPPERPSVTIDVDQMMQVLINLLTNAVEAMPEGGQVRLETQRETNDGSATVVIRVIDDGPGISTDGVARVFEPFFSTKADGTGLGLCISAKIVERHGGRLELESSSLEGTIFAIRLPEATGATP